MTKWYAIVYKNGPQAGEVKSYGTVVTDPLDISKYEAVAIDHQPRGDEMWNKITKAIVPRPIPSLTSREKLKAKQNWSQEERDEAIRLLL